jgi:hypothetical protein
MIELKVSGPGLQMRAALDDAALTALLNIVREHQLPVEEAPGSLRSRAGAGVGAAERPLPRRRRGLSLEPAPVELDTDSKKVHRRLGGMSIEGLWGFVSSGSFPEKLVALVGWMEARGDDVIGRRSVRRLFAHLGVSPPANPGRDLQAAARAGWIGGRGEGLGLTNDGWHHLGGILEEGDDRPGAAGILV